MANKLAMDPDSIKRAADELQRVADDFDRLLDQFASQLSSVGDPWGTDMLGMLIGGGYVAIESLALKTYESVVESFDEYAEGLADMAESFRQVESDNRADLYRLGRQV